MMNNEEYKNETIQELLKIGEELISLEEQKNKLEIKLGMIIEIKRTKNIEELREKLGESGFRIAENLDEQKILIDEIFIKILTEQEEIVKKTALVQQKTEQLIKG